MFYNFAQKFCKKERNEKEVENIKKKVGNEDKRRKREKRNRGRKDKGKDKDEIEISAGGAG